MPDTPSDTTPVLDFAAAAKKRAEDARVAKWDDPDVGTYNLSPADALHAALRECEEKDVAHVVIFMAIRSKHDTQDALNTPENPDTRHAPRLYDTTYKQAGSLNPLEQLGLLTRNLYLFAGG